MSGFQASTAPAAMRVVLGHMTDTAQEVGTPDAPINVALGELTSFVGDTFFQILGVPHHTQTPASLGNLRRNENYDIQCLARSFVGSVDDAPFGDARFDVIAKAYAMVVALEGAITDDPTLDGNVRFAQITSLPLVMGNTGDGWAAEIAFVISCEISLERT